MRESSNKAVRLPDSCYNRPAPVRARADDDRGASRRRPISRIARIKPPSYAIVHANERLVSVTVLITAGLGVSLIVAAPYAWGLIALLIITAGIGTDQVLRSSPSGVGRSILPSLVLPSLITLGASLFLRLPFFRPGLAAAIGLLATSLVLGISLWAEYQTLDPTNPRYRPARLIRSVIAYAIAYALFSAIFAPKFRSILSATAILLASGLICAQLLRGARQPERHRRWVAVVALVLGQVTWVLNYWVLGALAGGAVLFLVFYTATGIIRAHLDGRLAPPVLGEHLIVAGLGFAAVIAGGLWLR